MHSTSRSKSIYIVILYAIIAALWIIASDQFLERLTADMRDLAILQTYKGMVFVVVSSLVIFLILSMQERHHERDIARYHSENSSLELRLAERGDELEKIRSYLVEQDQANTRFMGELAHSLRTPLSSLNIRLDMLRRVPSEQQAEYLDKVLEQIGFINQLLNDMLDSSTLDAHNTPVTLQPVDLNAQVALAVALHTPHAESAGLRLTFVPEENLPLIMAENSYIVRIVDNLIANGIKYTSDGEVNVYTAYDAGRQMVRLVVRDTGMGIASEDMSHLFERFYRGRRVRQTGVQGTGLGLDIVRRSLELVQGTIDVQSEPNNGTTFTIWLNQATAGVTT